LFHRVALALGVTLLACLPTLARATPPNTQTQTRICRGDYPSTRDASNPLMLANAPGANPLSGAQFFVDGPAHGNAAGAIVHLLGRSPSSYSDSYSYAQLTQALTQPPFSTKLAGNAKLRRQVQLLEKIASEPEEQRFSVGAYGGHTGKQVQKDLCQVLNADPNAVPIFTTALIYQAGDCEKKSTILARRPQFESQVNQMTQAIGPRPAVMLLELDAIGSSSCMAKTGALPAWEADIHYEISQVTALPHVVAYVEGGYSDANSVAYTARALNAVGVNQIRGFFANDTHNIWTIKEIHWAQAISKRTGGAHIIINTATNGHGPKLNPHPKRQGVEDLCNPPGRGIGPRPTTSTGFKTVDAFMWTGTPGNSSGHCHGGPSAGTFWLKGALTLAANAQGKLGPGFPADRY
jgi:hypothetical protein